MLVKASCWGAPWAHVIVGEEDWIHGECNCLVNMASSQTIMLSWGAKKKERKEQRRVLDAAAPNSLNLNVKCM